MPDAPALPPPDKLPPTLGRRVGGLLRENFFAGLLVVVPLAVIAWIATSFLSTLWKISELLPASWQPKNFLADPTLAALVNFGFTIAASLAAAVSIAVLGWASKQFLGQRILGFVGELIQRIPVLRSVYSALDQLLRTMASQGGMQFNRVVYLEYPRKGTWVLAFVTGSAQGPDGTGGFLHLYVPTTPNPTSGFHLMVPEDEVKESGMSVEEAFKTILSLGIAHSEAPTDPGLRRK